jgi:hypothetical protein
VTKMLPSAYLVLPSAADSTPFFCKPDIVKCPPPLGYAGFLYPDDRVGESCI